MESKNNNTKAIRELLGLDELSPMETGEIQGGESKEKCKCKCDCKTGEEPGMEDVDI